jgi:hypothetical protein
VRCAIPALLVLTALAAADEPAAPDVPSIPCTPASAPASRPSEPAIPPQLLAHVDELIAQLGDERFEQREAAHEKLEAIGEPARAALTRAVESTDAEVADRASRLLEALDRQAAMQAIRQAQPPPPPAGGARFEIITRLAAGVSILVHVTIQEGATTKLTLRKDPDGLHVEEVRKDADGIRTAKADAGDLDDLKKKSPYLHDLVVEHFGPGGPNWEAVIRHPVLAAPRDGAAPPAPDEGPADALEAAVSRIGVRGHSLDAAACGKLGIAAGVLVDELVAGAGDAAALGVRVGDVITAINGRPLSEGQPAVGPPRAITVYRVGEQIELTPPPPPPGQDEGAASRPAP